MTLFRKIPVTIDNKEYEVRIYYEPGIINIAVFYDGHPATGFRHRIHLNKKLDVEEILQKDSVQKVIEEIIRIAREDISGNRWERFLAGIKA